MLRWRIVAVLGAAFLATVLVVAVVGERLAASILQRQVQQRLEAARDRGVLALQTYVDETRTHLTSLAADRRTVTAYERLRRATRELYEESLPGARSVARERAFVRSYLGRYYADELRRGTLQLDSLMVPESAAIWLQATFFSRQEGGRDAAQTSLETSAQDSLYDAENEIWQPIFENLAGRAGWQDILLADVADGRVVYSVSKTPVFQTSLIDGPYSESGLGSLFRSLRGAERGSARLTDFTRFLPAHDLPVVFAGAPIFDGDTRVGVLLVQEHADSIDRILSAGGNWSALGLGATGDLFVTGSDSLMRSRSRFLDQLRSTNPTVGRLGTTVLALGAGSIPEPGESNTSFARYVNHRHVPVLGAARRLDIAERPWTVVAEIEAAEAFAPLKSLRQYLALVVLGALLLAVIATLVVAAWILRPMRQILGALQAVRGGNSAARIPAQTVGEIGAVGFALNELIEAHAEWVEQESAERQQRESEVQELVAVLKDLARGNLSQRARVDGHLAGLANAVNAMAESVGHLTDRLCVVPPRVVETSYAMQSVADQVLRDTERQTGELGSASQAADEILAWLHGCTIDAQGVIDAASRVEQVAQSVPPLSPSSPGGDGSNGERRTSDEWGNACGSGGPLILSAGRYRHLRMTVDAGEALQSAIRTAIDAARRIRTGAEALRGHAQTLQLVALDLHEQGGAGSNGSEGGADSHDVSKKQSTGAPRA